jgi:hypothetical protein
VLPAAKPASLKRIDVTLSVAEQFVEEHFDCTRKPRVRQHHDGDVLVGRQGRLRLHRAGPPAVESLPALYDELLSADREHGDVSVIHEDSGWSMSAHRDGRLVFEHLEQGGERHMIPVSKERVLDLWRRLIEGDMDSILAEPWQPGHVHR